MGLEPDAIDTDRAIAIARFKAPEWDGMPEFVQPKLTDFACIKVRFRCQEDLDEFAAMIGQPLTPKTKSIWHPSLDRYKEMKPVYIDTQVKMEP